MHTMILPRKNLEEGIRILADRYPACFFENPRFRRPLKKYIEDDLRNDGVSEQVIAAVSFYMRHFDYQRCIQTGVQRVDLNGQKAGVVTEAEQRAAEKQIREEKEELQRKHYQNNPVEVLASLHERGRIPDDQLRKLTLPAARPSMKKKTNNSAVLSRLQTLLGSANTALETTEDEALRSALAVTSLKLLVDEAQKVIASLDTAA